MFANIEQQYAAGREIRFHRLEGHHRHHRIIYILRILSTDRRSQRMIMSMISRKMDKADRGVSQPNETRECRKGKVGGKILL